MWEVETEHKRENREVETEHKRVNRELNVVQFKSGV